MNRLPAVGSHALVAYNVVQDPRHLLFHERFLAAWVGEDDWVVVTPDEDMYIETLVGGDDEDILVVRYKPQPDQMPAGMGGARIYGFPHVPQLDVARGWIEEAELIAAAEVRRRGLGAPAGPPPPRLPRYALGAAGALGGWAMAAAAHAGPPAFVPGGEAEAAPGLGLPGADRAAVPLAHGGGGPGAGAVPVGGGLEALAEALGGAGAAAAAAGPLGAAGGGGDARTLPVKFDATGPPYREFREATELCSESEIKGFVVRGPRTAAWVLRFMSENGGTPLARHSRFRSDARLSGTDPGVTQHETLCKLLQVAATVDQLDCTNLGVIELICREIQMIEEKYAERLRSHSELSEESHHFLGTNMSKGNVCMSPALRDYIASEMRDEASILKERRKAREERQLQRAPPADSGTSGGGGGHGGGKKK